MSFDVWRETPIPMYLECYFHNLSNLNEILQGKETKLRMTQMGPYVFRETHEKVRMSLFNKTEVGEDSTDHLGI